MVEMLSRIEESRRQGEIWAGNIYLNEITKGTATNGKEAQILSSGTPQCYEFGGLRSQQKGARRKPGSCGTQRKVFQGEERG